MWRELLHASRPVSWVNTAYPFGAAYLLTGGGPGLTFWVGALFFLVPYNLAMYGINDVFDHESDLRNPRKGGVEGGLVSAERAAVVHPRILWAAALSCLPFCLYLVIVGSWLSTAVLALSVFAVLAYSLPKLRFKERPGLDAVTSSTHFSSPAWFGVALSDGRLTDIGLAVLVGFFLWGCAAQAFGAVQDVLPDRQAGLKSVATALGARPTVRISTLTVLLAGLVLVGVGVIGGPGDGVHAHWPVVLAGLLAVPYAANSGRFWHVTDADSARTHLGWRTFLWLNYAVGFLVTLLILWWALG
ncbi:prenyltransferase [Brevibacterium litoralis]|uniref:prenyltransferase n=1 Tax=Brevibacterium litoralis TaxID=3138935 RepID=UPI0032EB3F9B